VIRLIINRDLPYVLIRFIPFENIYNGLVLLFLFIVPLSGVIGYFLGGYLITPVIVFIHKKIIGKKLFYGIHYQTPSEKIHLFSKSIFPVLMSINLSTMFLTPELVGFLLDATLISEFENISRIFILVRLLGESVLLMITFGVAMVPFAAVWFLEDSGIVYSNKTTKVGGDRAEEPLILKSMGDWFQTIFKSYAGLGAIVTYILIIQNFVSKFLINLGLPGNLLNIPTLILWLGLPLYLVLAAIPCIIFHDLIKNHRIRYVRKVAGKLKIRDAAKISFELEKE